MKKFNVKKSYPEGYEFDIILADIEISSIPTKSIVSIKKNPKSISKHIKIITVNKTVMLVDEDNLIPNKSIHDRKLNSNLIKKDSKRVYWISNILKTKQISNTKVL